MPDRGLDQRASYGAPDRDAHDCDYDVWRGREVRAPHQSFSAAVRVAGRNWRVHGIYPVELSAPEHRAGRPSLGRGDGSGVFEGAGDLAAISFKFSQRAVELG